MLVTEDGPTTGVKWVVELPPTDFVWGRFQTCPRSPRYRYDAVRHTSLRHVLAVQSRFRGFGPEDCPEAFNSRSPRTTRS